MNKEVYISKKLLDVLKIETNIKSRDTVYSCNLDNEFIQMSAEVMFNFMVMSGYSLIDNVTGFRDIADLKGND